MNHTQQTKIGPAHAVPHRKVWIEGKHLAAAGFTVAARYDRSEPPTGGLVLTLNPSGRLKVAGKGDKPIIDTSGSIVPRLFPEPATHVTVTFAPGIITLTTNA